MSHNTCTCILKHGPRRGESCDMYAVCQRNGEFFCRRHMPSDWNVLCEYRPNGICLTGVPIEHFEESMIGQIDDHAQDNENLANLKGYINMRINGMPFVFIAPDQIFTKLSLAKEIADSVQYVISRPDIYDVGPFENFVLRNIKFNWEQGIFMANMS